MASAVGRLDGTLDFPGDQLDAKRRGARRLRLDTVVAGGEEVDGRGVHEAGGGTRGHGGAVGPARGAGVARVQDVAAVVAARGLVLEHCQLVADAVDVGLDGAQAARYQLVEECQAWELCDVLLGVDGGVSLE